MQNITKAFLQIPSVKKQMMVFDDWCRQVRMSAGFSQSGIATAAQVISDAQKIIHTTNKIAIMRCIQTVDGPDIEKRAAERKATIDEWVARLKAEYRASRPRNTL